MEISVYLKKVQLFGYHGLYPEEAINGNTFEIDLLVTYQQKQREESIDTIIDYAVLYELILTEMKIRRELLETLGNDICNLIKLKFPQVSYISLDICKLQAPIRDFNGQAGVQIKVKY
jgi:dihydroneopterin aldolase